MTIIVREVLNQSACTTIIQNQLALRIIRVLRRNKKSSKGYTQEGCVYYYHIKHLSDDRFHSFSFILYVFYA